MEMTSRSRMQEQGQVAGAGCRGMSRGRLQEQGQVAGCRGRGRLQVAGCRSRMQSFSDRPRVDSIMLRNSLRAQKSFWKKVSPFSESMN